MTPALAKDASSPRARWFRNTLLFLRARSGPASPPSFAANSLTRIARSSSNTRRITWITWKFTSAILPDNCERRVFAVSCGAPRDVASFLYRRRVSFREELPLVPVGINRLQIACFVEGSNLIRGQIPSYGIEVLPQLLFIARADDDRRDRRPLQQPIERNLGDGPTNFGGHLVEGVNDRIKIFVGHRRSGVGDGMESADLGQRLAAADSAGKASPAQRTPHQRAHFFFEGEGHQLPLVFTPDERVVNLVGDKARPAVAVGDGERFHQVPAGKIGASDVTYLALAVKFVQRVLHFFDWRHGVEAVQVIDVDIVGTQAAQAGLERAAQMNARRAKIVRPGA